MSAHEPVRCERHERWYYRARGCEQCNGEELGALVFDGTPFKAPEFAEAQDAHVQEIGLRVQAFEEACRELPYDAQQGRELEVQVTVEGEPKATHRWRWDREQQRALMQFWGDVTT